DAVAQAAEITLDTELPDGLPPVRGDERRLLQVLNQLLSNAVKFTEAGGTVTVGARREDDCTLLIVVRDTGMGIAPEQLERVFEPFSPIDAAVSPRCQGASLYLSRALVARHGGRLTLRSRVGEGTTAEIRLPTTTVGTPA
ncbi:MAG TPA: ATP-binding protein, partial [Acetobacteraceae bacterium]|nr:ATP-binding protein [Acetobacteraceae bacterium]